MTSLHISKKLAELLDRGIANEAECLQLIVVVRKLLECEKTKKQYQYLTFHCDWAVHYELAGSTTQRILKLFDAANLKLRKKQKLNDLPQTLRMEIEQISKMRFFEKELRQVLQAHRLRDLENIYPDGWAHFLHLYTKLVEYSPLVILETNKSASISSVTLSLELANQPLDGDILFKVKWMILDKNGSSGEIYVLNSFSLENNN